MQKLHLLTLTVLLAAAPSAVRADTYTITAAPPAFQGEVGEVFGDSAQVGATGPGSSQNFMDVEGSGNGTRFESFGVIDFNGNGIPQASDANFNPEIVNVLNPNISLGLTDGSFSATKPGTLDFFLSDSSAPLSGLKYQASDTSATAGVGSQLGDLYFLGSYAYTSTSTTIPGALDSVSLTLPGGAAQSYFLQQLNNGGNIRFAVTAPGAASTVGSFQGAANSSPPVLTFTASVPEANTTALLTVGLLGLVGLGAVRRRRSA